MIPASATFRRAEGLSLRLRPCDGPATVHVTVAQHGFEETVELPLADALLLCRMTRWETAAELGVPHEKLVELAEHHLCYWSDGRPSRALTGGPLPALSGPVALRRNQWPDLLVYTPGHGVAPIAFMPRRRSLDRSLFVGVRFVTMEMEQPVVRFHIVCCERHAGIVRDLLPLLDGRHTAEALSRDEPMREMLSLLDRLGLLEPHTTPPAAPPGQHAQITWLGHATVLYEARGRRILVDPLFNQASFPRRPGGDLPPDPRAIGPVDAILITHGDNDHLNPQALLRFARSTPIFIPKAPLPMAYQVDNEAILRLLGFTQVTALADWERAQVGELTVVAAPFRGEDWGLTLAAATFLIAAPDDEGTVYLSADSAWMPEVYDWLAAEVTIDLALLGVSGCAEAYVSPPEFGYGSFYEPWIAEEKRNQWVQLCNGPQESAEAAVRLGARRAFGYASGGTTYMQMAYSDRGTHEDLARALTARGAATEPVALPLATPVPVRKPS